jgi:hypothetical protein
MGEMKSWESSRSTWEGWGMSRVGPARVDRVGTTFPEKKFSHTRSRKISLLLGKKKCQNPSSIGGKKSFGNMKNEAHTATADGGTSTHTSKRMQGHRGRRCTRVPTSLGRTG